MSQQTGLGVLWLFHNAGFSVTIWLTMSRCYSAGVRMGKLRVPARAGCLMSCNTVPRRTSCEVLYGVHDYIHGWAELSFFQYQNVKVFPCFMWS